MSDEKQIEELSTIINEMSEQNAHYYDEFAQKHEAFADGSTIARCLIEEHGYRKASDVAAEIFEQIDRFCMVKPCSEEDYADLRKKYIKGEEVQ